MLRPRLLDLVCVDRRDLFQPWTFRLFLPRQRVVSALPGTSPHIWPGDPERVQEAISGQVTEIRKQQVSQTMAALFGICGERCSCRTERCRLKEGGEERFVELTQAEEPPCPDNATCAVCSVFSRHLGLCNLLGRASRSRGQLMSQRLASSVAVHQIYNLAVPRELPPAQRTERKRAVKALLCTMLDCQRNRLMCLRHIGELARLVPKLLSVQMSSGFALFWDQLRKVARTVNDQPTREAKLAALVAFRRRLPQDSPWRAFLTSDRAAEEEAILSRFSGNSWTD